MSQEPEQGSEVKELDAEWTKAIQEGFVDSLDCFELFDQLINISPHSISDHLDERDFQDLTPEEQDFVKRTVFSTLETNPNSQTPEREYQMPSEPEQIWDGIAVVRVFKTSRSDEDIYLHEIHFPDGKMEYAIAPLNREI